MATDKCDKDIFKKGYSIAVLDACMHRAEEWVQSVAQESGQRVDWHYSGGRANVLYIGDYAKVRAAVEKLEPKLAETPDKPSGTHCRCEGSKHEPCSLLQFFPENAHGPYRDGDLG